MKYVIKFSAQTVLFVLIMLLGFYPYYIWNAKKHEDHDILVSDYCRCFRRFKSRFLLDR